MKKFLIKYQSFIFVFIIILILFPIYTYKLGTIPTNVTGDETTYLNVVYRILFEKNPINPFELMEDHTKAALSFYWMGLIIRLVGFNHTVFGMRLAIVIPAVGTLVTFFFLLRQKTNNILASSITLLLGTNVLFLNFARSGWLNIIAILFGLLMIVFLNKGFKKQQLRFFIFAGLCSSFSCYWYLSGYIYPISAIIFFLILFAFSKERKRYLKYALTFLFTATMIILPIFTMAFLHRDVSVVRPSVVFIFNSTTDNIPITLWKQSIDVAIGLILLDNQPIGKGFENPRYFPIKTSIVDPIVRFLFLSGLIYYLYKFIRKPFFNIWMIVFSVTFLTVGILTIDAPNLARTILVLPCIYFLVGVFCFAVFNEIKHKIHTSVLYSSAYFLVILLIYINVTTYFKWAQSQTLADDRQPAIEYSEFYNWQQFQIDRIKSGYLPIINQQWYNIRNNE